MTNLGLTVYGCEPDETVVFKELSPHFGVTPTMTTAAVSETNVAAAPGNRCISVGHKSEISAPMLLALKETGVEHISTRSIGVNHIDLDAAGQLGITVENVTYAPDGVADFTLMLILMPIRNAKDTVRSANNYDFRLRSVRGRELRDMTVGVVGVGNIGTAVIRRLHGFGCRVLASNNRRHAAAAADFVPLDELLRESDIVTLHLPLNPETHHLIGRKEIETMKQGAYLINTGRGALVDTDALVVALEDGTLGRRRVGRAGGRGRALLLRLHEPTGRPSLAAKVATASERDHHTAHGVLHRRALYDTVEQTLIKCLDFETKPSSMNGRREDRDLVRGLLGGARRVREVRDGGRGEHRHAEVRADLHRHHQDRCLEDVRAAAPGVGRRRWPTSRDLAGSRDPRTARRRARRGSSGAHRRGVPGLARQVG